MHWLGSHADGTPFGTSLVELNSSLRLPSYHWQNKKFKNGLLPGQAEGRVTSMDTTKQQA
jgi:hypothetical protein